MSASALPVPRWSRHEHACVTCGGARTVAVNPRAARGELGAAVGGGLPARQPVTVRARLDSELASNSHN
jgi:hypothetical protein